MDEGAVESGNSVLVVAGRPELRDLLRSSLENAGYEIRSASGGHEAVLLASAYRPRAVVLTATLEDGDGYRVCRMIKTRHWQGQAFEPPKVVLLADHKIEHDADIERMFREFSKADLVLDGPFEPGAFLDRVVATIGQADEPGAPPRARRSMWGRVGEIV